MLCQRCGSTDFDEENGLFYCSICQTQTQGFTQEAEDVFIDRTKSMAKEITSKRKTRQPKPKKSGVLWTTTEAFTRILLRQMSDVFVLNADHMDWDELKTCTTIMWRSYLRKSGLSYTEEESGGSQEVRRRLHPASRFRDIQILTNKADNHLPPFKNGSTALGFVNTFKLGADGVVRTVEELDSLDDYVYRKSDNLKCGYDVMDLFDDRLCDGRDYVKTKSRELKISLESRKQLMKVLSEIDLKDSFEETINLSETYMNEDFKSNVYIDDNSDDTSDEDMPQMNQKVTEDETDLKDNVSNISDENWFENDDKYDDFDKELMKNLTESTKLYAKYIPLSYLKNTKYILSDYFMDLMSLPKTLTLLNIVMRLLSSDVFAFDLVRWAHEGLIPYQNCMTCLPDDWLFISNDFPTFTSSYVPSYQTINKLSAKMAKHIGVKTFPRPNLHRLLKRLAQDLNLPKDIVTVIDTDYNLYEHFSNKLDKMAKNCRKISSFPVYERWTLMAIVLVLKRLFILNDSSERRLSYYSKDVNNLFNWHQWERYSRVRLETIISYHTSLYSGHFERIKDVDLIVEYSLKRSDYEMTKTIESIKPKKGYKKYDFRCDLRQEFKALNTTESQTTSESEINKPLYPLTTATEMALKRVNNQSVKDVLSTSFEDKCLTAWTCGHGKAFHRGYDMLAKDPKHWSSAFKLLISLSCIILGCRTEDLIPIIKHMERIYFNRSGGNGNKRRK